MEPTFIVSTREGKNLSLLSANIVCASLIDVTDMSYSYNQVCLGTSGGSKINLFCPAIYVFLDCIGKKVQLCKTMNFLVHTGVLLWCFNQM